MWRSCVGTATLPQAPGCHQCGGHGDERTAYGALGRTTGTDHAIAYGVRTLWQRSLHSSHRSNDRPGRTGKPSTGQREAGVLDHEDGEVRVTRNADPVLTVTGPGCKPDVSGENTGKPDDAKASCPVWGGAEGERLLTQYLACGLLHQVSSILVFTPGAEVVLECGHR